MGTCMCKRTSVTNEEQIEHRDRMERVPCGQSPNFPTFRKFKRFKHYTKYTRFHNLAHMSKDAFAKKKAAMAARYPGSQADHRPLPRV